MAKYLIKSVEHVYDAFDEYEHANTLKPLVIEADSVKDAAMIGQKLLQDQIHNNRKEGGFLSSGTFIVELKSVTETSEISNYEIARKSEKKQMFLKTFICHASEDKPVALELSNRLKIQGFIDPWIVYEQILPGQEWDIEIKKAVRGSHVVIVILSRKSTTKEGYIQKEIKFALDIADEKPEGTIYIIPVKVEECNVPQRLQKWQWFYLNNDADFGKFLRSLKTRAEQIGITFNSPPQAGRR